jgi:hypothetical protein
MSLIKFIHQQWSKLGEAFLELSNTVNSRQLELLSKPSIDTPTHNIIINHKIKSRLLEILSKMNDLNDEMLAFSEDLKKQEIESSSKEDLMINKTISDMTPFLFLYYMSVKTSTLGQSSPEEVD